MSSFPLCRWEKLNDLLTVNNWDKILNTCQIAVLESNKLPRMLGEMHILQVQFLNLYSKGVSRRYPDKFTWFYIVVAQTVKCLSTMRETQVRSLGREDLLEKEMATHSGTIAWKIPWTEKPDRLQSMGSQRIRHDWVTSLSPSLSDRIQRWKGRCVLLFLNYFPLPSYSIMKLFSNREKIETHPCSIKLDSITSEYKLFCYFSVIFKDLSLTIKLIQASKWK